MKIPGLVLCALIMSLTASSQYWQQQTDYTINVSLNDQQHILKGEVSIEYSNNSPDDLPFIWFHLWQNAYKNDKTAFARQLLRDKDGKARWRGMKDKGSIDELAFIVDGKPATVQPHPDNIDIIKVILPQPLKAGQKAVIKTPFTVHIPSYVSRSGHLDHSYLICQWYPKPAVYDRKGWHPIPYLDQGEFYSEYGSFEVSITLPSGYVVGATGQLQNADELSTYKALGKNNIDSAQLLKK